MENLLPVGFYDLLAPKTYHQRSVLQALLNHTLAYGYEIVEPPLVEFEETFTNGAGEDVAALAFRVIDPQSHKMMAIRSDMTPQISRIVSSRLSSEALPLRLTYAGKVLRVVSDHFHAERELVQAGLELVGESAPTADAEVISIALEAFEVVGIRNLSVDFNIPCLPRLMLASLQLAKDIENDVIAAIQRKDIAKIIRLIGEKESANIIALLDPALTLAQLKQIALPKQAAGFITHLEAVIESIKLHFTHVNITLDPLGSQQFSYHTSLGFSIFSKEAKGELARGGRYEIEAGSKQRLEATGLSFYINEVFRNAKTHKAPARIYVPMEEKEHVKPLQEQGYITVLEVNQAANPEKEAKRLHCQAFCQEGKATLIS